MAAINFEINPVQPINSPERISSIGTTPDRRREDSPKKRDQDDESAEEEEPVDVIEMDGVVKTAPVHAASESEDHSKHIDLKV